jgi:hypothetical protein
MKPRILLVNPPTYDFSAYDFWLKPHGMLRVAGFLRGEAEFHLFDFLDRLDSRVRPDITAATVGDAAHFTPSARRSLRHSPTYRDSSTVSDCRGWS